MEKIISIQNNHFHASDFKIRNVAAGEEPNDVVIVQQLEPKIIAKTSAFTLKEKYNGFKVYLENSILVTIGNLPPKFNCCIQQTDKNKSQLFGNLAIKQLAFNPNLPRFTMNIQKGVINTITFDVHQALNIQKTLITDPSFVIAKE